MMASLVCCRSGKDHIDVCALAHNSSLTQLCARFCSPGESQLRIPIGWADQHSDNKIMNDVMFLMIDRLEQRDAHSQRMSC
eukprot:1242534-Amphidinium_carterae.2